MLHILKCFYDELEEDMKDHVMDPRKCEMPCNGGWGDQGIRCVVSGGALGLVIT